MKQKSTVLLFSLSLLYLYSYSNCKNAFISSKNINNKYYSTNNKSKTKIIADNNIIYDLLLIRGGDTFDQLSNYRSEFVFGKDRELFHASLDFKWLYSVITDKNTWRSLFRKVSDRWQRLDGSYKTKTAYKEQAIDILLHIRENNENCTLRYSIVILFYYYNYIIMIKYTK